MKILVLGGTLFLSRAVAADAVARGHDVVCAARGQSGSVPKGARLVHLDRADPDFGPLGGDWDAVVDVARDPGWVSTSLDALAGRAAHWIFVSTISVYAEEGVPGGTPETLPLHEPIRVATPENYGANKVACEQDVQVRARRTLLIRPGLIVGPGDPSGRYSYWPQRLADAGSAEVLAPGDPARPVQIIDVSDLASWIVRCAEAGTTGTFDGVGPALPMRALLAATARGVGTAPELTWVSQDFLTEHEVNPWTGPRSLPLWLPLPAYAGMLAHAVTASLQAGLRIRPIEETARDTLAWLREHPESETTGLTRKEEEEVLAAWHTIHA